MKTILQRKEFLIFAIILAIIVYVGITSVTSITRLQGNARVVNFAGIVRGGTQKLIKEEIMGWYYLQEDSTFAKTTSWYPNDALLNRLDGIVNELLTGKGQNGLIVLQDKKYLDDMLKVKAHWEELTNLILQVRTGHTPFKLFDSSQIYFTLVNNAVFSAEAYADKQVKRVTLTLILINGLFLFLIFTILFFYMRGIANPVKKLTYVLSNLARGKIGDNVVIKAGGEIRILADSVNAVSDSIRLLSSEISDKISNYDKGISFDNIRIADFEGCYKEMAENIDRMTMQMDLDFKNILECISEFSTGNFEADLDDMPGERAIANKMIYNIRENLISVHNGILNLVESTVKGILDERIDTGRYEGGWKEIVFGLNTLLDAVSKPYIAIISTLRELTVSSNEYISDNNCNTNVLQNSDAEKNNDKIQALVKSINEIAQASRKINNIVVVMDNISKQTNLLAMNASIEAARSGESGRGFKVISQEVRNLAIKSSNSSKEISEIVEDVLKCVEIGVNLASETSVGFKKISEQIYKYLQVKG